MRRRGLVHYVVVLTTGLLVGSFIGEVLERYLPEGVAKSFFTNSVSGSIGPVSVDLVAIGFTVGPLTLDVNLMSVIGLLIAAYLFRSFF